MRRNGPPEEAVMMVLDVRKGGTIHIGDARVVVINGRGRTQIGVEAPGEIPVYLCSRVSSLWLLNLLLWIYRPFSMFLKFIKGGCGCTRGTA